MVDNDQAGLQGRLPHHVIRPPASDRVIDCVLALEYYGGELLSGAISRAIRDGDKGRLFWRLTAPAYHLATQHNRTVDGTAVGFTADCSYLDVQLGTLRDVSRIGRWDTDELRRPCGLRADRPRMWEDQQVWLHGFAVEAPGTLDLDAELEIWLSGMSMPIVKQFGKASTSTRSRL
jgi:hypothetical protein